MNKKTKGVNMKKITGIVMAIATSFALTACGGGGGASSGSAASGTGVGGGTTFSLAGTVTKGPMNGSSINVVEFNSLLSFGAAPGFPITNLKSVGSGQSTNGKVTLSINPASQNKILVAMSDAGSYTDEATGQTITFAKGQGFRAIILPGETSFTISPLSEIAFRSSVLALKAGLPATAAAVEGRSLVLRMFGVHPEATPDNPLNTAGVNIPAMQYAGILAGFSQLLQNPTLKALRGAGSTDFDFYNALIYDMADGALDGKAGATQIKIPGLQSFLPALSGTTFKNAITTFIAAHPNFNPKAVTIPFKAPTVVKQPAKPVKGYLTVSGLAASGTCASGKPCGSSNANIPLTVLIPATATYTSLGAGPRQYQINFDVPNLFSLSIQSIKVFTNYTERAVISISRYDAPGNSLWMTPIGNSFAANGITVDTTARTITFSNALLPYTPDVFTPMDTLVLNGTLKY